MEKNEEVEPSLRCFSILKKEDTDYAKFGRRGTQRSWYNEWRHDARAHAIPRRARRTAALPSKSVPDCIIERE